MSAESLSLAGVGCFVTRSGYTGEDGFEISAPADEAVRLAETLMGEPEVRPAGLGARDTLRLEAGLCLYGNDIDETTTPVEAGLSWIVGRRRRAEGGLSGRRCHPRPDRRRRRQKARGHSSRRNGAGAHPRAHHDSSGEAIGEITSGGFGPSVEAPVAMGYVASAHAAPGTPVTVEARGKALPATVAKLPFVELRYFKTQR